MSYRKIIQTKLLGYKNHIFLLFVTVVVLLSGIEPVLGHKNTSQITQDSIRFQLNCPQTIQLGTFYSDTTVVIDCEIKNIDTSDFAIQFTSGYGFRVPEYPRVLTVGKTGKIRFSQTIQTPGKFTKTWTFELNGLVKQNLSFVLIGELKK